MLSTRLYQLQHNEEHNDNCKKGNEKLSIDSAHDYTATCFPVSFLSCIINLIPKINFFGKGFV